MWENTEQRDSFIMYTEQWPALSLLSDAQLADLMRAIFALHGAGCSAPELDLPTQAVFLLMRPRFGANKARYEEICRRNQENGRRGGRPRRAASADPAGPRGAKDADGSAAAGEAEETPPAPASGVVRGGVRKARSAGGAGGGSRRGAETPPEAFSAEETGDATPPDIFRARGGAWAMAGEPDADEAAGRSSVGDTAAGSIVGVAPEAPADENLPGDAGGRFSADCGKTDAKPKNRPVFSENRKTLTDTDPDTDPERNKNHPLPSCEEGRGGRADRRHKKGSRLLPSRAPARRRAGIAPASP